MVVLCHQFCSEYLWKFSRCSQIAELFFFFCFGGLMVLCLLFAMICFCWLQVVTTILRQNFKRWERKLAPPIQGHYYWPEKVKSPLEIREALLPQMTSSEYLEVLIMKAKWSRRLSYHFYNSSVQNFLYSDAALMFRWSCRFTSQSVFPPSSYPDCKF